VLPEKIEQLQSKIAAAAKRAGRSLDEILLIAVTKKFPPSVIVEAYHAGLRNFGENYVQEFADKSPALAALTDARFHLIGHLQSNKTGKAAELFHVIQTIDTPKLARRLSGEGKPLDVMIEVKLSDEESKAGAAPDHIPGLIESICGCPNLRLLGLMTMPPWTTKAEESRPYFVRLRRLADQYGLKQLSMGMSNDFEVAIEEGATMIRVGTALFGPRQKP
jgi:pyridoxal phosphate enzyme (YggS family)